MPVIFVIGWRGELGIHDEPQHVYQGQVTLQLLEDMGIPAFVVGEGTSTAELRQAMDKFRSQLAQGQDVAFVIRKGSLSYNKQVQYENPYQMSREDVIRYIVGHSGKDPVISTTGKASRELYEIREACSQGHGMDFLTVGSMGHSSSIALGVAISKPRTKVWCIDGDGAVLMHMGAMAVIGACAPKNLVHIVLNNAAHETVGGMPTVANSVDLPAVARACGYSYVASVEDEESLAQEMEILKGYEGVVFIEVKCALGARADLGRPKTTPLKNKEDFMHHLAGL